MRLATIPVSRAESTPDDELATLRRSFGQYRGQAERAIDETAQRADEAAATFEEAVTAAQRVQAELEEKIERLTTEVERLRSDGVAQTEQLQSAFAEAQLRRDKSFSEQLAVQRETLTSELASLSAAATEQMNAHVLHAETSQAEIEASKARLDQLVGIAGDTTLVGGYSENASDARSAAFWWTAVAILLALAAVAIGIWLVGGTDDPGTDWDLFAGRSVLAASTAGIAAYAARQASEQRHVHREAQHVALQLAALKPFLDDFESEEERNTVMRETALKILGEPRRELNAKNSAAPTPLAQIAETVDLVDKIRGS